MICRQGSSAPHKDQDDAAQRHGTRQSPPATRNTAPEGRLRITIGGGAIEATLADSDAARDFASLLPLTLAMNDLFRREKFATLPRAISNRASGHVTMPLGPSATGRPGRTWRPSIGRMAKAFPRRASSFSARSRRGWKPSLCRASFA